MKQCRDCIASCMNVTHALINVADNDAKWRKNVLEYEGKIMIQNLLCSLSGLVHKLSITK